ncbi:Ankyrin_repeat-containing domain superfamily [Hexamita inflata]|uniref:Ankyrin repeat-containing domain superfamily n=1 Tax=Hexamita inflata TaxID=28002 RepID=A0AA86PFR1_9EUKA|nr:Ankyrin repeat-containing domain superfamily [Hexamita inflata]
MGCSPTASSPESKEWFRSIFQNDILKIQHLKQFCTGSYNNNVTALHLSIVLNRFQIFSEVLDEINLLTKKSCSINGIKIEAESSALQIAIQTDNLEMCKILLEKMIIENQDAGDEINYVLEHAGENTAGLIKNKRYSEYLNKAVKKQMNILKWISNCAIFQYMLSNFDEIPQQYSALLKQLFADEKYLDSIQQNKQLHEIMSKLKVKVDGELELLVKQQFGDLAGSKFIYLKDE